MTVGDAEIGGGRTRAASSPSDGVAAAAALVGQVDYPMWVVTAADGWETSGCLAGFVTQCSIRPPRFLVCLSKQNHTFFVVERSGALALHLLGHDQHELAAHFGELSGDVVDKMAGQSWWRGSTGAPVLTECAAWVEGRVLRQLGVGDHEAFIVSCDRGGPGPYDGQLTYRQARNLRPGHPAADATTLETATGNG